MTSAIFSELSRAVLILARDSNFEVPQMRDFSFFPRGPIPVQEIAARGNIIKTQRHGEMGGRFRLENY